MKVVGAEVNFLWNGEPIARRIHDLPQLGDSGFVLAAFGEALSINLAKKIQNLRCFENQAKGTAPRQESGRTSAPPAG
jgi:hypothetical protein